jgi:GT2 family glycosyltransferase
VIVPTFDRPGQLRACLEALAAQSLPPESFEVIVVDDGGSESPAPCVAAFERRMAVRVVRQENRGPAAARNAGASVARAPVLAFTDDDCRPEPGWLACLTRAVEADAGCLVGGRVQNALPDNAFSVASQTILESAYAHHNPEGREPTFFASLNFAVSDDGFRRVGGFDTTFRPASEDRDFCARWREHGLRLAYAPDAVVRHAHDLSAAAFWRQHFAYGRGAWRYHGAARRRGHGHLARDLPFHGRFMRKAMSMFIGASVRPRSRMLTLSLVWQLANTAGFLYEAVMESGASRSKSLGL